LKSPTAKLFALLFLSAQLFTLYCRSQSSPQQAVVLTGLDQIQDYIDLFANHKIGIITNHTAINREGKHITDIFLSLPDVQVTALFGPEHGVRGQAAAGENVASHADPLHNIPIYSLYGATKRPTPDMLKNVDLLVFDIQDIGARFYTYIWTMFYAMQSAAENNIAFVVLDRPNPITGKIEGPMLDRQFASFVGVQPIPVRHGLTVGELARLFNGEGWLGENKRAGLTVIPLKNWRRDMWLDETGLEFIPPSPNMPSLETATIYPGTCLLEGTNVSEGRGTDSPFMLFGAPWIDAEFVSEKLNALKLAGVNFEPIEFTPISMPGKAPHPKYENKQCYGARIRIVDRGALNSFVCGVHIVKTLRDVYPQEFKFRADGFFIKLCGTDSVQNAIVSGENIKNKLEEMSRRLEWQQLQSQYLLYD
jgi:uncharacterized protein YbbC (DUF1343 family)